MDHRPPFGLPELFSRPPSTYPYFRLALKSGAEFGRTHPLGKKKQVLVEQHFGQFLSKKGE